MKQTLQSQFQYCVAPYLSNGILPPSIMGQPSNPFILDLLLFPSHFYLINVSFRLLPQIASEEASLPRSYRSTVSQFRSSFCSSLHSYRERIGLVPSPICPSCVLEPHTTFHVTSASGTPDRVGPMATSTSDVAVPVDPTFLRPSASFSSSP